MTIRSRFAAAALCTFACISFSSSARAGDIIYDNGAGGAAGIGAAYGSDVDDAQIVSDDVAFATNASVTGVEWTGVYFFENTPPAPDDFTINIYADDGGRTGIPMGGAPLHSFNVGDAVNRTDSGNDFGGADVFNFSAAINFVLPANTTVWVSIFADTVGEEDDFFWGVRRNTGNAALSLDDGGTWFFLGGDMDFRLIGTIEDTCTANINDDDGADVVDTFDLLDMLAAWGACGPCVEDIANDDDVVDTFDLLLLLEQWGSCE